MTTPAQDTTQAVESKPVSSTEVTDNALFKDEKAAGETKTEETPVETEAEGTSDTEKVDEKTDEVDGTEQVEDFKLTVATDSGLSEKDAEAVAVFAKENKLSQEAAQKILDDKASLITNFKAQQQSDLKVQATAWVSQIKSDTELGGDKFDSSIAAAREARNAFATPAFAKMLDDTGLGNHPELVRTFARIGKKMQNDTVVNAKKSGSAPTKSAEDLLYGDT